MIERSSEQGRDQREDYGAAAEPPIMVGAKTPVPHTREVGSGESQQHTECSGLTVADGSIDRLPNPAGEQTSCVMGVRNSAEISGKGSDAVGRPGESGVDAGNIISEMSNDSLDGKGREGSAHGRSKAPVVNVAADALEDIDGAVPDDTEGGTRSVWRQPPHLRPRPSSAPPTYPTHWGLSRLSRTSSIRSSNSSFARNARRSRSSPGLMEGAIRDGFHVTQADADGAAHFSDQSNPHTAVNDNNSNVPRISSRTEGPDHIGADLGAESRGDGGDHLSHGTREAEVRRSNCSDADGVFSNDGKAEVRSASKEQDCLVAGVEGPDGPVTRSTRDLSKAGTVGLDSEERGREGSHVKTSVTTCADAPPEKLETPLDFAKATVKLKVGNAVPMASLKSTDRRRALMPGKTELRNAIKFVKVDFDVSSIPIHAYRREVTRCQIDACDSQKSCCEDIFTGRDVFHRSNCDR